VVKGGTDDGGQDRAGDDRLPHKRQCPGTGKGLDRRKEGRRLDVKLAVPEPRFRPGTAIVLLIRMQHHHLARLTDMGGATKPECQHP
jgi:hypothetical protein